jgi:ABC-type multidrug transport system fused ATPase/permease subunit
LHLCKGNGALVISYVIWLFVFLFVSYGLGRLYAPLRRSRFFKICFAPGFFILGGLKLLACSISGAEIRSVRFFDRDREAIQYDPEEVSMLGKVILATFPIIGALLVFALVAWAFSYLIAFEQSLGEWNFSGSITDTVAHFGRVFVNSLAEMLQATADAFTHAGRGNLLPFLFLYLLISILLAMPPATRELKYAVVGIIILCIIIYLVTWTGLRLSAGARDMRETLWIIFSFALALLVYVTAVTFAAITINSLLQSLFSKRNKPDETRL